MEQLSYEIQIKDHPLKGQLNSISIDFLIDFNTMPTLLGLFYA